ncbi:MAG: hypothetical protein JKY21_02580 [Alcanivorax sp.]|nr:hypothetical protein [Alcanivorax sp.]
MPSFSHKQDDRLLILQLSYNATFALPLPFLFLGRCSAAALTLVMIVCSASARHYPNSVRDWRYSPT